MLRCPDGYYADEKGLAACKACDEGFYCQMQVDAGTGDTTGCINPEPCPKGFYCERLTSAYGRTPCRLGFYGAAEELKLSTECTACTDKFYCPKVGMTDTDVSSFPCMDGYLCGSGSDTVTGTDTCPADKYCTAGTENDCSEADAFSNIGGLASDDECIRCPPGKICPTRSIG